MTSSALACFFRRAAIALLAMALSACAASTDPADFRTVAGPETPRILTGLAGRYALDAPPSGCYWTGTIDLSTPRQCVGHLHPPRSWVAAIAPDRDHFVLRLRMTHADGPDAAKLPIAVALERVTSCARGDLFCEVPGETIATWTIAPTANLYHQVLSVSPDGRRVALVPRSEALHGPGYSPRFTPNTRFAARRNVGRLKILDLQTKTTEDTGVEVVDEQPISWSQDGRQLLLVRAEPVEKLTPQLASQIDGHESQPGQGVPVIETLDLATKALTMLAIGQQPLWSPDQRTLLYQPADDHIESLTLADRTRRLGSLPGMSTRYEPIAIAFVGPRRVLYWALPTAGSDPAFTTNNSPLIGPKQLVTLKVADLDTGEFATVFTNVDPRARVGYRDAR